MADPNPNPLSDIIERIALLSEREGHPRIAGRIFALLLLTDRDLSLDEIADGLSVSRASVSVDARRLEHLGMAERVSRPGDRKDYYQIARNHHLKALEQRLQTLQDFVVVLAELRAADLVPEQVRIRLEDSEQAYRDLLDVATAALARMRLQCEPRAQGTKR